MKQCYISISFDKYPLSFGEQRASETYDCGAVILTDRKIKQFKRIERLWKAYQMTLMCMERSDPPLRDK